MSDNEGDIYPFWSETWNDTWGGEPDELPDSGSIKAYLSLKEIPRGDLERFRRIAESYGAVYAEREKEYTDGMRTQFQVFMLDEEGVLFGYHYSPSGPRGYKAVRFYKGEVNEE